MNSIHEQFIFDLLNLIQKNGETNADDFAIFKRRFAKKYKSGCIDNRSLIIAYKTLVSQAKIAENKIIENILRVRKVRTNSGVAVVAVLTKPYKCPGKCAYCPTEKNMPKSYLSNEPAVMRAIASNFDPYQQVQSRIKALELNGHSTDKIELIVMGGTFSYLPKTYQNWFVKSCFAACNDSTSKKPLPELQKMNEGAKHRIVGLTLETRPDFINEKEIARMRKLGATRVELGIQSIYDDILDKNKRGHSITQSIKATKLLKDAGFKINYHIMLGLPGSNFKKDLQMMKTLFLNADFQPDMLKIYPCVVLKNTDIYKDYQKGIYKPYSDAKLSKLLCEIKKDIPYYVRIARIIRDIPKESIIGGSKISNLRQYIEADQKNNHWKCKCIRCREIKEKNFSEKDINLFRIDYDASGGKEIFLSYEDASRTKLYSLLRLRIPSQIFTKEKHFLKALQDAALIREVHTYGQIMPISQNINSTEASQHKGLGKKLIAKAEEIAQKEFGINKIAIISGVGVRDYYKKLGYRLEKEYMTKKIKLPKTTKL